jgi:cobalt-zinc-cadmium efflux system outer membrane protein
MLNFLEAKGSRAMSCRLPLLILIALTAAQNVAAQQVVSLKTFVDSAIKYSPALKGSQSLVSQQQSLLKSAFNLPNPEILLQNPTGHFYTVGVQQVFDFPTVYGAQRKIQKENIRLAESAARLTGMDVKYQVHVLYSELQYQHELMKLWQIQDSLYHRIADNAERAFKAGSLDFVQASFARVQAGQVRTSYNLAKASYTGAMQQLRTISGIPFDFLPDSLTAISSFIISASDTSLANNYSLMYSRGQIEINEKRVQLEKQKALPGFTVAYLNQGEKNTVFQNRFYAGLRIPLWFWQYKGNITAAKEQAEASRYNAYANQLQLSSEMQAAYSRYVAYTEALLYYSSDILKEAEALTNASNRFYASGHSSYRDYLGNLNEAVQVRKGYLETLKNHNQALIYILYLNGTL